MTSRLLQWLGVALVLALVGGAFAGFMVLGDRVRVVIAADASPAAPDPTALLRDDVATLARDLAAVPEGIARQLRELAEHLEQRGEARERVARADRAVVAAELAELRRELAALPAARPAAAVSAAAPPAIAAATAPATPSEAPAPVPAAPTEPTEPAAPAVPTALARASAGAAAEGTRAEVAAAGTGATFLSFALPSARGRFDELHDYTVLPALSRVGFDAKSTLHDFSGVTSAVRGSFRADFDDPAGAWSGELVVDAATLATGIDGRDANLREHLDTEHHATIRFEVERFVPAAGGVDVAQRTARGEVRGHMTIRGTRREFTMPVAIALDPQQRVVLTGQAPLALSDFGVPVPSQLGLISMQDEVVVWIALRARAGGVAK